MKVIFECGICGRRFYASQECQQHEDICGRNKIIREDRQRVISDVSTAIVNDFIENPKILLDKSIEYLRDINDGLDPEDRTDLSECGIKDLFELFAEMNEDSFHGNDIRIDEIRDKCLYDFEKYVYTK